jgi:probable rRNA maturation factor
VKIKKIKRERRTSNVERPTSKEERKKNSLHFDVRSSTLDVRRSHFIFWLTTEAKIAPTILAYIRKHLLQAHGRLTPPLEELSLALVNDKKMSQLHQQFLGIPGPTDVLTFPLEINKKNQALSGEIVICVPEARRRCRETGQELRKELLLYALHGLLHLCGFDDRTDRQFQRMHRMEDQILTRLGVGPVFAPPDRGDD